MKKTLLSIASVLLAVLMLASCGKEPAKADVSVKDIYNKITESFKMPEETTELSVDNLLEDYGIESSYVADSVAVRDSLGYKDEIVIIKAADANAAKEIETLLNGHIDYQKDCMRDYDPEQLSILESSIVTVNGEYVAMFISADQDGMLEVFNSFFK